MLRKLFSLCLAAVLGWAGLNLSIHGNLVQGILFLAAAIILVLPAFFGMEIGSVVDGTFIVSLARNPVGTLFDSATQSFETWVDSREQLEGEELASVEAAVRPASLAYDASKANAPDTSAFDPDAVIRNYLDNRPGGPPPLPATATVALPTPAARPTFGRKAI